MLVCPNQSHPEDRGDFWQGSTENISECNINNQLELSVYENSENLSKVTPVYG